VPICPLPQCPPLSYRADLSTLAKSTLATSCRYVHSCNVHPCHIVLICPLLQCPPLPHHADMSTPALSTPANSAFPYKYCGFRTQAFIAIEKGFFEKINDSLAEKYSLMMEIPTVSPTVAESLILLSKLFSFSSCVHYSHFIVADSVDCTYELFIPCVVYYLHAASCVQTLPRLPCAHVL